MRYKLHLMFSIFCVAVSALSVYAQGIGDRNRPLGLGNYRIEGKVLLPDGTPARGVSVSASSAEAGKNARTDIDGAFTMSGLSAGNYSVVVQEKGYQTENELLTIAKGSSEGQPFRLVFHLRRVGESRRPANPSGSAPSEIPAEARAKYDEAMTFMTKDDPAKALPLLDQAIKSHPKFAAAYYEKGAANLKLKAFDKSIEAFVKALSLKPDYIEAKYGYGLAQLELKNYPVAEAAFRDVLKERKDMPEAHLNLGVALFHLKSGAEAQTELQTAVTMKGGEKLALGHLYLGQIYMLKKDNANAIAELQKYLDLAPKAPNAEKVRSAIDGLKKQP